MAAAGELGNGDKICYHISTDRADDGRVDWRQELVLFKFAIEKQHFVICNFYLSIKRCPPMPFALAML